MVHTVTTRKPNIVSLADKVGYDPTPFILTVWRSPSWDTCPFVGEEGLEPPSSITEDGFTDRWANQLLNSPFFYKDNTFF